MKIRTINTNDAVGTSLSHDLTLIDPSQGYKGARFKKGHIVTSSDIQLLKKMGREHLSILELDPGEIHEDDAALRLGYRLETVDFSITGPSEGKCSLIAEKNGLLVYEEESIHRINEDELWIFSTLPNKIPVNKGETVAAWRIAPLVVKNECIKKAEEALQPFQLMPFLPLRTALITTGREIWEGCIHDSFLGKLEKKLKIYNAPLIGHEITTDDVNAIHDSIENWLRKGAEVVICTGGMSVDADDLTPSAIKKAATQIVFQGVPVLPGSNLMLAQKKDKFILGVPACAVHSNVTVLDTVMHRIYASLALEAKEIRRWGVGGLCRSCKVCNYPTCVFGARTP